MTQGIREQGSTLPTIEAQNHFFQTWHRIRAQYCPSLDSTVICVHIDNRVQPLRPIVLGFSTVSGRRVVLGQAERVPKHTATQVFGAAMNKPMYPKRFPPRPASAPRPLRAADLSLTAANCCRLSRYNPPAARLVIQGELPLCTHHKHYLVTRFDHQTGRTGKEYV